ncbi:MAG: molybdopterin cofactor-binding domain-containing protein, partial [Treponemataceae bacterium]
MSVKKNKDQPQKILPEICYSDIFENEMLCGLILRSTIACGQIESIECPPLPENYAFFTAKDIPLEKTICIEEDEITLFADQVVDYEGQAIGILVGENQLLLHSLLSQIIVHYHATEEKTHIDSIKEDQMIAHQCFVKGEVENAFEAAAFHVENTYELSVPINYFEPTGATVLYKNDGLQIFIPTHLSAVMKKSLSSALGISDKKIEINETPCNDQSFSMWITFITAMQAAIASFLTKKNIKIIFSPPEDKNLDISSYPFYIRHRTAINDKQQIIAMDIRILVTAGFFNPYIKNTLSRMLISATGAYVCQNICIDAYALKSLNLPALIDTKHCDTHLFFALENHINTIIQELNADPIAFRENNSIINHELQHISNYYFDCQNLPSVLKQAATKTSFLRKYYAAKLLAKNIHANYENQDFEQHVKGVGIAMAYEGNGFSNLIQRKKNYFVEMTLAKNETLSITCPLKNKKLQKIWMNIVSQELQIPVDKITFLADESEKAHFASKDFCGSISIMTQLILKCCTTIKKS